MHEHGDVPEIVAALLEECLRRDRTRRPSFADIVSRTRPGSARTAEPVGVAGAAGAAASGTGTGGAPVTAVAQRSGPTRKPSISLGFEADLEDSGVDGATGTTEL